MAHQRVYTSSAIVINRLASLLEEKEIACIIKNQTESASLAGFGSSPNEVDLYIDESDIEAARPIVEAFDQEQRG